MATKQPTHHAKANPFWWRAMIWILAVVVGYTLYCGLAAVLYRLIPGHPLDGETVTEILIAIIAHALIGGISISTAIAVGKLLYGRLTRNRKAEQSTGERF